MKELQVKYLDTNPTVMPPKMSKKQGNEAGPGKGKRKAKE